MRLEDSSRHQGKQCGAIVLMISGDMEGHLVRAGRYLRFIVVAEKLDLVYKAI